MKSLAKAKSMKPGFSDGGEVVDYTDSETSTASAPAETEAAPAPEYKSFKEAFAGNRKSGAKSFEYKGKKYTTDLASAKAPAAKPASESLSQGLGRKYSALDKAHRDMPAETSPAARSALTSMRDKSKATYEHAAKAERTGKSVVKLANGGLVKRAAVKSHGKAC